MQPVRRRILISIVVVFLCLWVFPAHAELVDFTGIDGSGGVFATSVGGETLVEVTVDPITNVDAAGSTLAAEFGGAGLRQITQNSGGGYNPGDQSTTTFSFAQPSIVTLSTNSGTSAADDSDILRIEPVGVAPGGADFWIVSGTSNVDVSEDANHVLTLTGTSGSFMTYVVEASEPISSLSVNHESTASGPSFNSTIYDLDVPLATVSDVPTLGTLATVLLGLFLATTGWLVLRLR